MTKTERNLVILNLALGGVRYSDIARQYGLSNSRVPHLVSRTFKKMYPYEFEKAVHLTREAGKKRCVYASIKVLRELVGHAQKLAP